MGSPTRPAEDAHAVEFYVLWTSVAGNHGLHGPYPFDHAQQLVDLAPGAGKIVRGTTSADALFRITEVLLSYAATPAAGFLTDPVTALLHGGIGHAGTASSTALKVALDHVLAPLLDSGRAEAATLADLVSALVDAGFTARR